MINLSFITIDRLIVNIENVSFHSLYVCYTKKNQSIDIQQSPLSIFNAPGWHLFKIEKEKVKVYGWPIKQSKPLIY